MIGRLARQLRRLGPIPGRTAQVPPQASGSRAPQPRTGLQPEADLRAGAAGAVVGAAGAGWPAAAASPERGFGPTGPDLSGNRSPMARGTDANLGSTAPAPACRSAAVAAGMQPGSASADGTAVRPEASIVGSKPLSTSREAHAGRAAPAPAGSAATGAGWCRDPVAGGALVVAAAPSGEADRHQAGDARGTGAGPLLLASGAGDRPARAALGGSREPAAAWAWRLRWHPVCASTERELDGWLRQLVPGAADPLPGPIAVLARRQRFGRGQRGRSWLSPAGGVWISAALPWPAAAALAAAPALALAVGLALQLEELGLTLRIKWPNDLLLLTPRGEWAKLAGVLPRLRLQAGQCRWLRLGVGLNGRNPVPLGATSLRDSLGWCAADPLRLAARVLRALEWTMVHADQPLLVRDLAAQRLLLSPKPLLARLLMAEGLDPAAGWQPLGLELDGALLLGCGAQRHRLQRSFSAD